VAFSCARAMAALRRAAAALVLAWICAAMLVADGRSSRRRSRRRKGNRRSRSQSSCSGALCLEDLDEFVTLSQIAICGQADEEMEDKSVEDLDDVREDERAFDNDGYSDDGESFIDPDTNVRIVSGWMAQPRPWMALIRAVTPFDDRLYETCGGAIVNKRYVLTAGHCVCMSYARNTHCVDGKLQYDPRSVLKLYVGVNDMNLEAATNKRRGEFEYPVDRVKVHPGRTGTGLTFPDLALIRSKKAFKFSKGLHVRSPVLPICLPKKRKRPQSMHARAPLLPLSPHQPSPLRTNWATWPAGA